MSVYRGDVLIAAGGRDVNPSSILAGQNIERTVSPDDNCVTIATCDCVCFEEVCAECNLVAPNISANCIYCSDGVTPFLQNYVTTPGCCNQKICCLTQADYQVLVSGGTVNPDTYYFTSGNSTVTTSDFSCFCAGSGIVLTCSGGEMSIASDALNNICASNDITVTPSAGCVYIGRNMNDGFCCLQNPAVASITYGCLNTFCIEGLTPGIYVVQPRFCGSAQAWCTTRNIYFNGPSNAGYHVVNASSWTDLGMGIVNVTGDCYTTSVTVGTVADETCIGTTLCPSWVGCSRGCIRILMAKISGPLAS